MSDNPKTPAIGDDLLRGAGEIAEFVFGDVKHRRKVYHLTGDAKAGMPYFKIGSLTCARKSSLLRWIAEQEERQLQRSYPDAADSRGRSIVRIHLRGVMDKIFQTVRGGKR